MDQIWITLYVKCEFKSKTISRSQHQKGGKNKAKKCFSVSFGHGLMQPWKPLLTEQSWQGQRSISWRLQCTDRKDSSVKLLKVQLNLKETSPLCNEFLVYTMYKVVPPLPPPPQTKVSAKSSANTVLRQEAVPSPFILSPSFSSRVGELREHADVDVPQQNWCPHPL